MWAILAIFLVAHFFVPRRYRDPVLVGGLLTLLVIILWGLPWKLILFILVVALALSARVLVGRRM